MSRLSSLTLPDFGIEPVLPEIRIEEYESRLGRTVDRMGASGLNALVVYADREHCANMSFLTGFDPRFEEALLLLDDEGGRLLLVGNECMGFLPHPALRIHAELFQELSLLGQQRDASRPLRTILGEFGVGRGKRVGCVGWKYFGKGLIDVNEPIEVPAYLVDLLRELTGEPGRVVNATSIFMDAAQGLRSVNSADQIARFEYASIRTSESIKGLLSTLREGVAEEQLERCFHGGGLPRSCHAMVSFAGKARRGLSSPSANRAVRGAPYTCAFGVEGSLSCRAGMVAEEAADLPADLREFYPVFASSYFDIVATWYSEVRAGAAAGDVVAAVERARNPALMKFAVNPGHLIGLDEWVHSPFTPGSRIALGSGMALQMDIIPISQGPFCCVNAEDGIALADADLRDELRARYPALAARIQARRAFMQDALGITLDASVLPLSNLAAWFPPFALDLGRALVA